MRRLAPVLVLAIAAAAILLALPSGPAVHPAPPPPAGPAGLPGLPAAVAAAPLAVAWTAQSGARFEPCGCVAGMHGGLVRRASLLARLPAARRVALEGGGWSGGGADHQLVRARRFLAGLAAAGIDAAGLGRSEIALGRRRLASVLAGTPLPVLCANLPDADGLGIRRWTPVDRPGLALAITAIAPGGAAGDGLVCGDPAEALLAVLAETGERRVIVLADLDEGALAELARAVPGLTLVLGGAVQGPSPAPLAVGAARVAWAANEGKTLAWWPWGASTCAFELIADGIPDHPDVRSVVRGYQDELGGMGLDIDDRAGLASLAEAPRGVFAGDTACATCHPGASRIHAGSGHAHALDSLRQRGYQHDPDCLRCHVTGLGQADGWRRNGSRADLGRIACESCHGRASRHAAERQAGRRSGDSLDPVTPATCLRCHDGENSPGFAYDAYWPRIRHDAR